MFTMMSDGPAETRLHTTRRGPPALQLPKEQRSASGLVVSLLFHGALLALIILGVARGGDMPVVAGPGLGGLAGGGGGGGGAEVTYIDLPPLAASAPAAAEATAADVPVVIPPPVEEAEEAAPVQPAPEAPPQVAVVTPTPGAAQSGDGAGTGTGTGAGNDAGSGGGSGGGTGTGIGAGVGPGTGGDSTGITPPSWRFFAPPLERPPKELRGQTITIRFWVRADGTVERYQTDPEIEDDDYREKFSEIALGTLWRPARRRDGTAVPAIAEMQVTLPSDN
jgi:hypothetical protein